MNDYHFIYLLKEKQDIDNKLNIYKIGKSTQENTRRVKSYPSGSYLYLLIRCDDCHSMETKLINKFKNYFDLVRGREYFKGDIHIMMDIIYLTIQTQFYQTPYILENNDYKLTSGNLENNKIINKLNIENDNISDILSSIEESLVLKQENEKLSQKIITLQNQNKEFEKKILNLKKIIHDNSFIIHEWEERYNKYKNKYYDTLQISCDWENKYNLLKKSTEKENIFKKFININFLFNLLNIKKYCIFNFIISYFKKS